MYITLDNKYYISKPSKEEIGKINNRLSEHYYVTDIRKTAELIGNKGCTWCPAIFNGKRKKENFIEIQLIALDFDGGIGFDEIKGISEKYMIPILFEYETFSGIDRNKFRVVFMLDKAISDEGMFDYVIGMLMRIFTGCDTACRDVSRMFFGGKELFYYNETEYTIEIKNLEMNFALFLKDKYGATHYKARLKKFTECFQSGRSGKNSPCSCNKNTNGEKLPNSHKPYRKDILNGLYENCRLYQEFTDDSQWLYYSSLYGLATNLIHVETGEKCFLQCIDNSQYMTYKRDWKFYMKYFKDNDYQPMQCNNFCPYCTECCHGKNMLSSQKVKRKEIIQLNLPEYAEIEEVRNEMYSYFYDAMDSNDNKIHVIKAQTAIGKTHMYLEFLKNTDKPCIIAVPTNILKNEVYGECISAGINAMATPSIYEIEDKLPSAIYNRITHLYSTGKHRKVMSYIQSQAEQNPVLAEFINTQNALKGFNGHIITTHNRILYSSKALLEKYDIIIDEDILKTIIKNQISIEISDIEELLNKRLSPKIRNHLIHIISLADEKSLFSVAPIGFCKVDADFNLNALLSADKFYSDGKSLFFYNTSQLHDMKYTILSATADEYIYRQYFGDDRVCFRTCQTVAYKGKLIQYFNHSYSRRYIEQNEDVYKKIKMITGDCPIITFKKFSGCNDQCH